MNRKDIFMSGFRSKLTYPFNHKDLAEFETIINFYEKENLKYKARWENLKNWIKSLPINEDNFDIIPECIYNEYGKVGITKKAILEKMIDLEEKQSDE